MPIQIGARPLADFSSPVDMMEDCHRRIEHFLQVLRRITARTSDAALSDDEREAMQRALNYFVRAAPRHTADEEESLFPRLRAMAVNDDAARAALDRLDELERDHEHADRLHADVESLGRAWLEAGDISSDDRARMGTALDDLAQMYERHIHIEDAQVFPAARRLLDDDQVIDVGAEMKQRRSGGAVNLPDGDESRS